MTIRQLKNFNEDSTFCPECQRRGLHCKPSGRSNSQVYLGRPGERRISPRAVDAWNYDRCPREKKGEHCPLAEMPAKQ